MPEQIATGSGGASSVRKMVARYDIRPRKRLGQSFLEDLNVVRRIVDIAAPAPEETIVEIGAGLGFMTEELAKRAGRVIAIEIDPQLAAILRERFAAEPRVEVVEADVLGCDFTSFSRSGRIKVVGNIPYHISTPILFRLFDFRRSIAAMILMVQKELADRITASPGTKEYGIPSVIVARYARTFVELTVPPTCFYPVPDVVSSVLRMEILPEPEFPDDALFAKIVRAAFAHRRKTLWNNLRGIGLAEERVERILAAGGIDRTRRAETLSVAEFTLLAKGWLEAGSDPLR